MVDNKRVYLVGTKYFNLPEKDRLNNDDTFGAGKYYFSVCAKNDFGSGPWSAPLTVWDTLGGGICASAQNLQISLAADDKSINLSWDVEQAEIGLVEKSTDNGLTWIRVQDNAADLEITAVDDNGKKVCNWSGVEADTKRAFYRVRAKDGFASEKIVGKYTFNLVINKMIGANDFVLPVEMAGISTAQQLIEKINEKAGGEPVTLFVAWDNENKIYLGGQVEYDGNGITPDSITRLDEIPKPLNFDTPYQINIKTDILPEEQLIVVGERIGPFTQ